MPHTINLYYDLDGTCLLFCAEELPVEFAVTIDHGINDYDRRETDLTATITRAKIAAKWFTRAELVEMFGSTEVDRAEGDLTESLTLEDAA